jgi:hypothetical protein
MLDPIGAFNRIRDFYISYLETAFSIQNAHISENRRSLLESEGSLCTDPIIEPLTRYKTTDFTLADLVNKKNKDERAPDLDAKQREAFVHLALSGLFEATSSDNPQDPPRPKHAPYTHQVEMLRRGIANGAPSVVTSGTGSGKTEAFLLPVFAMLAREALNWPQPAPGYLLRKWWQDPTGRPVDKYTDLPNRPLKRNQDSSPFVPQRIGESNGRPPAVRAMILYPMNALVEDQLARLRRALDSDAARACMDRFFKANRIFLGKYTSATPVTGHHRHPRPDQDEYKRRDRKLRTLLKSVTQIQLTQEAARLHGDAGARFLFPSTDGNEMINRWDMQEHPPDILVTNISMLNAMLAREVDAPIFAKTKRWLTSNDDAYFFLILDELHLQRGSAGTEVSFLLRLLIERLGLNDKQHRHKLRILASSASLPLEGMEGEASVQYLWDFFGSHGTWRSPADSDTRDKEQWRCAVLPGVPLTRSFEGGPISAENLSNFLALHTAGDRTLAASRHPNDCENAWRALSRDLAPNVATAALPEVVRACIQNAGAYLERGCVSERGTGSAPTELGTISERLFGTTMAQDATRTLMFIRGLGDVYRSWFPGKDPIDSPSFRVHLFFRSIEGLFAPGISPIDPPTVRRGHLVGDLTVERGLRFSSVGGSTRRLLEIIYCECCGELFFAGMKGGRQRGGRILELLPIDPNLDGLPDSASSQLFEELTGEQFGVFWPRNDVQPRTGPADQRVSFWQKASLDPVTGIVEIASNNADPWGDATKLDGYLFHRTPNQEDRHRRKSSDAGTCVPYSCPACGTSYEFRKPGFRLSPVRNFRTGFAKTTQLLATEIFEILRTVASNPKLVSFSDSRQDAAKAALDIERRHHEDLRRQILVETIREVARQRPSLRDLQAQLQKVKQDIQNALASSDPQIGRYFDEHTRITKLIDAATDLSIPMSEIVETLDAPTFEGLRPVRSTLRPYLRHLVELGVHPIDPTGVRKFSLLNSGYPDHDWYDFFEVVADAPDWRDNPARRNEVDDVRRRIVRSVLSDIAQTLFNKTYFALEETGLGYPTIPLRLTRDAADQDFCAACLRTLGDSYRLNESPYDDEPKDWAVASDVKQTERIFRFLAAAVRGTPVTAELSRILDILQRAGHSGGVIHTSSLTIRVPDPADPYWRCPNCGRVHLHHGASVCTRCFEPLNPNPTGVVDELRRSNFLGKRVERNEPVFRVHCEELTGQTDDPAERQRRFKGILLSRSGSATSTIELSAKEIDLLAVTTTMEVGIDIGPLQAVFQANMPPQRFNYQQRVGRAGRRGQSFSVVLTVCRSKSHDLYYFRHPQRITGDPPPPPFLTKRQELIARRLLRKAWLSTAFDRIRSECQRSGTPYPADDSAPDIHGEFVPTNDYFDPNQAWPQRLLEELTATIAERDRFAKVLSADSSLTVQQLTSNMSPAAVLDEIQNARLLLASDTRDGLAHTLAEAGLLPMFGMPTRVRNLYLGSVQGEEGDSERSWSTIDRDLDVAIFEFAPGAVIVKDKQQHRCIGFTGSLENPFRLGTSKRPRDLVPFINPFGEPFWLLHCDNCGSWHRYDQKPTGVDCRSCHYVLPDDTAGECRTPNGFRTDFHPRLIEDNDSAGRSHRSNTAEYRHLSLAKTGTNLSYEYKSQVRTYRLNRGPDAGSLVPGISSTGFNVDTYVHTLPGFRNTRLLQQMIDTAYPPPAGYQPDAGLPPLRNLWLAAPKTTDALFVAATRVPAGLRIDRVSGASQSTAVRAAALSAAFILVQRAALELDIDPEEFDIVDPRTHILDGNNVPVLQITDHLINGSGFCERLESIDATGQTRLVSMIRSIVTDLKTFPLKEFRRKEPGFDHAAQCDQACYLCLQRYGNQSYHGLLDWRLGLSFLEALNDPNFRCGLDGNFESPSLSDWLTLARRYATELSTRYRADGEVRDVGKLVAFRLDRSRDQWALVVHPLWDVQNPSGALQEAIDLLGSPPEFSDTFHLARRQVSERERLVQQWGR